MTKHLNARHLRNIVVRNPAHPGIISAFIVFLSVLTVLLFHLTGPTFHSPYWLDEAYVALSTRYPISDLHVMSSNTPIGFLLLLKAAPGADNLRAIPLIFLVLTVIGGYWFGFSAYGSQGSKAIKAGSLVALCLIFAPFLIGPLELKQYTAEAFTAILVLLFCLKIDADFSIRKVCALGCTIVALMTISHTVVFIGLAALLAIILNLLLKKVPSRRDLMLTCGISILTLGACLLYYILVDRQGRTADLVHWWTAFFPTVRGLPEYLVESLRYLSPFHNSVWALLLSVLFGLGIFKLWRLDRKITVTSIFIVICMAVVAGVMKVFPLLDQRTSTYLLTIITMTIALGTLHFIELSSDLLGHHVEYILWPAVVIFVVIASLPAMTIYPLEDTRDTTRYVESHFKQGDTVITSPGAGYGFSFYWPTRPDLCRPSSANSVAFGVCYPGKSIVILPPSFSPGDQLSQAVDSRLKHPGGNSLWVVSTHLSRQETPFVKQWIKEGHLAYSRGNATVLRF